MTAFDNQKRLISEKQPKSVVTVAAIVGQIRGSDLCKRCRTKIEAETLK